MLWNGSIRNPTTVKFIFLISIYLHYIELEEYVNVYLNQLWRELYDERTQRTFGWNLFYYLHFTFSLEYQPKLNGRVFRKEIKFGEERNYGFWCKCYPTLRNRESWDLLSKLQWMEETILVSDDEMLSISDIKRVCRISNHPEELEMRLLLWLCSIIERRNQEVRNLVEHFKELKGRY